MKKTTREELKAWAVMLMLVLASCVEQLDF